MNDNALLLFILMALILVFYMVYRAETVEVQAQAQLGAIGPLPQSTAAADTDIDGGTITLSGSVQ